MKLTSTLALGLSFALLACHSSQAVNSAERGNLPGARAALSQEDLSYKHATQLARAVLARDVAEAESHEGRAFVRSLDACAPELERPLRRRSKKDDAVAAEAALLLLEHGRYRGKRPSRYSEAEDGAWRALAARVSSGEDRLTFYLDDDERVRRTALRAALENPETRDVPALLEVSRVDPDALTRSRAIQTLGRIGGRDVLLGLLDRYQTASEGLRLVIVDAYAKPKLRDVGGLAQLRRIAESENGFVALHAASILSRTEGEDGERGSARLIRFCEEGTTEERRMALRLMPSDSAQTEATLKKASRADDPATALIAWARLLGRDAHRAQAERELLEQARAEDELSYQAKAALAAAGSRAALPLFQEDVSSPQAEVRTVAGYGLLRLEAYDALGPLLADDERKVRRDVGCRLLAARR